MSGNGQDKVVPLEKKLLQGLPKVTAMVEHVVNLGNFESVRFRAEVTFSSLDVGRAFEQAWETVKQEVRNQTSQVKNKRDSLKSAIN